MATLTSLKVKLQLGYQKLNLFINFVFQEGNTVIMTLKDACKLSLYNSRYDSNFHN